MIGAYLGHAWGMIRTLAGRVWAMCLEQVWSYTPSRNGSADSKLKTRGRLPRWQLPIFDSGLLSTRGVYSSFVNRAVRYLLHIVQYAGIVSIATHVKHRWCFMIGHPGASTDRMQKGVTTPPG